MNQCAACEEFLVCQQMIHGCARQALASAEQVAQPAPVPPPDPLGAPVDPRTRALKAIDELNHSTDRLADCPRCTKLRVRAEAAEAERLAHQAEIARLTTELRHAKQDANAWAVTASELKAQLTAVLRPGPDQP